LCGKSRTRVPSRGLISHEVKKWSGVNFDGHYENGNGGDIGRASRFWRSVFAA
jgi:hypothetical protein